MSRVSQTGRQAADSHVTSAELSNAHGVTVSFVETGSLERLEVDGTSVLLYPASPLEDGLGGLWLRRRDHGVGDLISLVGQSSPSVVTWSESGPGLSGNWNGLSYRVSFRLAEDQAAWFWHVAVMNAGAEAAEVDLVFAQDVALASPGAVRTNEYYVSQYLDLSPVEVPDHGPALAVRQNMPGPTPWCLVGSLGRTVGWATDALQLTGRGRRDGDPWSGLSADLPSRRLQHEHTVAALAGRDDEARTRPVDGHGLLRSLPGRPRRGFRTGRRRACRGCAR